VLVVEPDYLPDSEVFVFRPCLYPMKIYTPMKNVHSSTRGSGGGLSAGFWGVIPQLGFRGKDFTPEGKIAL
jgi:hypothetical protein